MTAETMRILNTNKELREELAESIVEIAVITTRIEQTRKNIDTMLKEIDELYEELGIEADPSSPTREETLKEMDDMFAELGM